MKKENTMDDEWTTPAEVVDTTCADILRIFEQRNIPVYECKIILKKLIQMVEYAHFSIPVTDLIEWIHYWCWDYDDYNDL